MPLLNQDTIRISIAYQENGSKITIARSVQPIHNDLTGFNDENGEHWNVISFDMKPITMGEAITLRNISLNDLTPFWEITKNHIFGWTYPIEFNEDDAALLDTRIADALIQAFFHANFDELLSEPDLAPQALKSRLQPVELQPAHQMEVEIKNIVDRMVSHGDMIDSSLW